MDHTGAPPELWFYCSFYVTDLVNLTASKKLGWHTPTERVFGYTPDISPFLHFTFFEPVYYYDKDTFPESNEKLGFWCGVTQNCGDAFTYYAYVPSTRQIIARSVLRSAIESVPNHRASRDTKNHVDDVTPTPTTLPSTAETSKFIYESLGVDTDNLFSNLVSMNEAVGIHPTFDLTMIH